MKKVNLADVPAEQLKSPGGKYAKTIKEISIALGREPDSLDLARRHPFDLTLVRIPPGKSYCPYHSHGAESELLSVYFGAGKSTRQGWHMGSYCRRRLLLWAGGGPPTLKQWD